MAKIAEEKLIKKLFIDEEIEAIEDSATAITAEVQNLKGETTAFQNRKSLNAIAANFQIIDKKADKAQEKIDLRLEGQTKSEAVLSIEKDLRDIKRELNAPFYKFLTQTIWRRILNEIKKISSGQIGVKEDLQELISKRAAAITTLVKRIKGEEE